MKSDTENRVILPKKCIFEVAKDSENFLIFSAVFDSKKEDFGRRTRFYWCFLEMTPYEIAQRVCKEFATRKKPKNLFPAIANDP